MCKACKMDPRDVKIMRQRQGAVEVDDFEKEVDYTPRKKKNANPHASRSPGCPGNDRNEHVYIWTTETQTRDFFSDFYGFHRRKARVCCGCGKRNGSDYSDEYMKIKERRWAKKKDPEKGVPLTWRYQRGYTRFRYWTWENEDEAYVAARKEYREKHGWTIYYYGNY